MSTADVNEAGRAFGEAVTAELVALREAAATCLRYLEDVEQKWRDGRLDHEAAANIVLHQRCNLRRAIERTGKLRQDGRAGPGVTVPVSWPRSTSGEER